MSNNPTTARHQPTWASGDVYEGYVGRWSRLVAPGFLQWLALPAGSAWLDVGCGTGVISEAILRTVAPARVKGIDRSEAHITYAQASLQDGRAVFAVADAQSLPEGAATYDAAVSGLVLNFVPDPAKMVGEMARVVRSGGVVAAYVWDYAGKMQMMRHFWNAAVALDPAAFDLDEGRKSPLCQPGPLADLFRGAGLGAVEVRAIDIATDFKDFDDFWLPFLKGSVPASVYAVSLNDERRAALRERLRAALPFALDGSIPLVARVWAVRGIRP